MSPALAPTVARDGPLGDFASRFDPFSRVKVAERAAARDDREIAEGSDSALPDGLGLWLLSVALLALSIAFWLVSRRRRDDAGQRHTLPRAPADPA